MLRYAFRFLINCFFFASIFSIETLMFRSQISTEDEKSILKSTPSAANEWIRMSWNVMGKASPDRTDRQHLVYHYFNDRNKLLLNFTYLSVHQIQERIYQFVSQLQSFLLWRISFLRNWGRDWILKWQNQEMPMRIMYLIRRKICNYNPFTWHLIITIVQLSLLDLLNEQHLFLLLCICQTEIEVCVDKTTDLPFDTTDLSFREHFFFVFRSIHMLFVLLFNLGFHNLTHLFGINCI